MSEALSTGIWSEYRGDPSPDLSHLSDFCFHYPLMWIDAVCVLPLVFIAATLEVSRLFLVDAISMCAL